MSAGRIVLLVFGILFVLAAFGLILGGAVLMAVDSAFKDNEGYFTTGFQPLEAESSILVTQQAEIHMTPKWKMYNRSPITIKIEAYNNDSTKPVFIGIAREADMNSFLKGREYDEVTGFDFSGEQIESRHHSGTTGTAATPDQINWVASATGAGTQTLTWDLASGNYSLALMNADGSSPIEAHAAFGARVAGLINKVGIGILIGGIVALVIGGVMIFFAARGW
jgi:hypothetical protein